jgi:hypothetical protein
MNGNPALNALKNILYIFAPISRSRQLRGGVFKMTEKYTITHYQWSAKRSLWIVAIISLVFSLLPLELERSNWISFQPVSRADLTRLITQNHPNPRLVKAVIQTESSWRQGVISPKGAIGLMQIMPKSGKFYANASIEDLFCPAKNIIIGCTILSYHQRNSKTLRQALTKYSGGDPKYYERVMKNYERKT